MKEKTYEAIVQLKKLDEFWHLRFRPGTSRSRNRKKVLAHFHGTVSYIAPDMKCIKCGEMPPEAIQMVLNLQRLKGKG